MSDHIPPKVLTKIFTKLAIKEIGRCSCVCKSWYTLITSATFISIHTKLVVTSSTPFLLVRDYVPIDSYETSDEHYSMHYDTDNFGRHINLNFPFKSWNSNFRVIGCFNGLVCLSNDLFSYTDDVIFWNPSIRKSLKLPKPLVSFESHGSFVHSVGFGFNEAKDDYKVVRVVNFMDYWDDDVPPHIEVYELKVGYWRTVNFRGRIPYVIDHRSPQAFLNGAVHWVGSKREDAKSKRILSFDMKKEVFCVMKVPDCLLGDDRSKFRVSVMGESLSLIPYNRRGGNDICDIWVMKQYGVCNSWTKQFSVDVRVGFWEVFGFRRNGEVLLSKRNGLQTALASFEPGSNRVKYIEIFQGDRSFDVENFVESLALLEVKGESAKKEDQVGYPDVRVPKKMKIEPELKEVQEQSSNNLKQEP